MVIDPKSLSPAAVYRFMISVIVPRPIAFVSTVGPEGRFNVAPFSYFCGITNQPPLLGVSVNLRRGNRKDTLRNIEHTRDFVVNVVDDGIIDRAVQASGDYSEEVDEFQLTGLTPHASDLVRAPRVSESPVSLECRLERMIELGATWFVVGEIVRAHVSDSVLTDGRVDVTKLRAVGRLGDADYCGVREIFTRPRPVVK